MRAIGNLILALAGFTALVAAPAVEASSFTDLSASYTASSNGNVSINTIAVSSGGSLGITLTDIPWPTSLASLSFEVVDSAGNLLGRMTGFGSDTFKITTAGTYYLLAFGVAGPPEDGLLEFGSYGLDAHYTPSVNAVPLPSSLLLAVSGFVLLAYLMPRRGTRRRERTPWLAEFVTATPHNCNQCVRQVN